MEVLPKILPPLLIAVFVTAFLLGGVFNSRTITIKEEAVPLKVLATASPTATTIQVPAVNEMGEGVITEIGVEVRPGTGRTLASIDNIFFFVDTQNSIRIAREVAQDKTGLDLSKHDLVYAITADAAVIEGPSAGAAITIATIAALEGKPLNPAVMITGTVFPDGKIGRVGEIEKKAQAAKQSGATLFLIPKQGGFPTSSKGFEYERVVGCKATAWGEYCQTEYIRKETPASPGIEVREVGTIQEALQYFY